MRAGIEPATGGGKGAYPALLRAAVIQRSSVTTAMPATASPRIGQSFSAAPPPGDQHDVGGEAPPHARGMAVAALRRTLVKMLAMRLPHPLAAQQPARQGDRRIGEEIERQDQRG